MTKNSKYPRFYPLEQKKYHLVACFCLTEDKIIDFQRETLINIMDKKGQPYSLTIPLFDFTTDTLSEMKKKLLPLIEKTLNTAV